MCVQLRAVGRRQRQVASTLSLSPSSCSQSSVEEPVTSPTVCPQPAVGAVQVGSATVCAGGVGVVEPMGLRVALTFHRPRLHGLALKKAHKYDEAVRRVKVQEVKCKCQYYNDLFAAVF